MANRRAVPFAHVLLFSLVVLSAGWAHADPERGELAQPEDWALAEGDRVEPDRPPPARGFEFSDLAFSVNAMAGFGTPLGLIGAELELNAASWLALGAGAGVNTQGLQLAALVRTRPFSWARPRRALAITFGAALATGPHRSFTFDPLFGSLDHSGDGAIRVVHAFDRVYWLQPEVGFELQAKSGFHLVISQGAAVPFGYAGHHCLREQSGAEASCYGAPDRGSSAPETLWTLTVMVGHAF